MSGFKRAERKKAKLRLALTGPSGSGKTYSGLLLAKSIGKRIAVIDTERGSASLYSHLCEFDVMELSPPYSPEAFIKGLQDAEKAGYDICMIDSITHEWNGVGGCMELVDSISTAKYRGNSWAAWNDVTPRHRAFIDAISQSSMHLIATMRSKTETSQVEDNGRKRVVKLGMKNEQRDGVEYEFTTVLDLTHDGHLATPSKDRTELFKDPFLITEETGKTLLAWLNSGEDPREVARREAYSSAVEAIELALNNGDTERLATLRQAVLSRVEKGVFTKEQGEKLISSMTV